MKPGLACYWLWGVHKKSLLSKVREAKVEDAHCGLTLMHVSVEFPSRDHSHRLSAFICGPSWMRSVLKQRLPSLRAH